MNDLDALDLIQLQLELECIGTDSENLLFRVPGDAPHEIGYFLLVCHAGGYATFANRSAAAAIPAHLKALPAERAFHSPEALVRSLFGDLAGLRLCYFSSYYFDRLAPQREYPDVVQYGDEFVVLDHGLVVSRAWAARNNALAAEIAVETQPGFRRQGYARQACQAWAAYELSAGKVALYSHNCDNPASRALAASLRLVHFVDGVWCYG